MNQNRLRRGLLTLVVAAAVGVAAAPASALTVAPTGGYVLRSTNPQFRLSSNGQIVNCVTSDRLLTVFSNGTGTAVDWPGLWGCTNSVWGSMTATQIGSWSVVTTLSASQVSIVVTIPSSGLQLAGTGCTWWAAGTITLSAPISGLPAVFSAVSVSASSLRVSSNNGGFSCFAAPPGLAVSYSARYSLDRSMGVWG